MVWATMISRRIAQPGKFKLEVGLYQSYHTSYKHQKSCLNYLQTINIFLMFCYRAHLGKQFYD